MLWPIRSSDISRASGAAFLLLGLTLVGCQPDESGREVDQNELETRAARFERLTGHDSGTADSAGLAAAPARGTREFGEPVARWVMPQLLMEISGLALTEDGRLLSHDDERGVIYEVDYRRGVVLKQFLVGNRMLHSDFEGIATANGRVYLLESNGDIYEMAEGEEGEHVEFTIHDTGLGKECEFEGMGYAPAINSLLLACKNVDLKGAGDDVIIYRWRLGTGIQRRVSNIQVSFDDLNQGHDWKKFQPSGIEVDPRSGNYVIVASIQKALAEVTPDGDVLWSRSLPNGHDQTEGIAITRDGILVLSDEAKNDPGIITLYQEW